MYKFINFSFLFFFVLVELTSLSVARVAVVDMEVLQKRYSLPANADVLRRELQTLQKTSQNRIDSLSREIRVLETGRARLVERSPDPVTEAVAARIENYDFRIEEKKTILKKLIDDVQAQISAKKSVLEKSSHTAKDILDIIARIAQTNGYTLVLDKNDPHIYYIAPGDDITQRVEEALGKKN